MKTKIKIIKSKLFKEILCHCLEDLNYGVGGTYGDGENFINAKGNKISDRKAMEKMQKIKEMIKELLK